MCPQRSRFADATLLVLRLLDSLVFAASGTNHLRRTKERSVSLGLSERFTRVLGVAEVLGAIGVGSGVLIRPAAAGLTLIILGAIHRKIFVWHTGFWGEKNSGWHYDLTFVAINLVVISSGGGRFKLRK
jgi:putative oxidoreductase